MSSQGMMDYLPKHAYPHEFDMVVEAPERTFDLADMTDADWAEVERNIQRRRPAFKGFPVRPGESYDSYFARYLAAIGK